jgi:hypothetical protein
MESVRLVLGDRPRRSVQSTRFGFSWLVAFWLRIPRFRGLEKLGFPWIISSESSLINGLHGIDREQFFLRLLSPRTSRRKRQPTNWQGEGTDCSLGKLTQFLIFCKKREPSPSGRGGRGSCFVLVGCSHPRSSHLLMCFRRLRDCAR